jgi:hypothetical protein
LTCRASAQLRAQVLEVLGRGQVADRDREVTRQGRREVREIRQVAEQQRHFDALQRTECASHAGVALQIGRHSGPPEHIRRDYQRRLARHGTRAPLAQVGVVLQPGAGRAQVDRSLVRRLEAGMHQLRERSARPHFRIEAGTVGDAGADHGDAAEQFFRLAQRRALDGALDVGVLWNSKTGKAKQGEQHAGSLASRARP